MVIITRIISECPNNHCLHITLECPNGQYGRLCHDTCPINCDGFCDKSTGICPACAAGFYGNFCDISKYAMPCENLYLAEKET